MATGLWLIGARGSVGTTVTAGLSLMAQHAAPTDGLVSELDDFAGLAMPGFGEFVVGGHDISHVPMRKRAEQLAMSGVLPPFVLPLVETALDEADSHVRPGVQHEFGRAAIAAVRQDLRAFQAEHDLDTVIVVNVSSTEKLFEPHAAHESLAALNAALDNYESVLPASSIYAYAALDAGFPFVDFTPSLGVSIPALDELAHARNVAYAGRDGKTGETLLKTALMPMFLARNLTITSWAGMNLLGGGDGRSLAEPDRKAAKLASKARSLNESLGYDVDAPVNIEYLEDMDEWKTAWNHVRFQGFLGTAMTLQFTWQGCDSILAAPLVIDLARFATMAANSGQSGALDALAFFFKDPLGADEHRLGHQFHHLVEWAKALQPSV